MVISEVDDWQSVASLHFGQQCDINISLSRFVIVPWDLGQRP